MTAAVHVRLARAASAVTLARDAALAFRSVLPPRRLDDLRLVLSELVTNAVVHGTGPTIDVRLTADGPVVAGEVVDEGDGFTVPPPPSLDAPGGRGLAIVGALSRSWGVERGSTHVWFELDGLAPAMDLAA
ncbi:MAG TPA: ATP-binding protein [Solirubrobacteraceae bacterium]|nr:ATP-binding protein [Solirubrobacteraceae bacterium]